MSINKLATVFSESHFQALRNLVMKADKGDPNAQMLYAGRCVDKGHFETAFKYYQCLLENDNASLYLKSEGQYHVARLYLKLGQEQPAMAALSYAADNYHDKAIFQYGVILSEKGYVHQASLQFAKLIENGHPLAEIELEKIIRNLHRSIAKIQPNKPIDSMEGVDINQRRYLGNLFTGEQKILLRRFDTVANLYETLQNNKRQLLTMEILPRLPHRPESNNEA